MAKAKNIDLINQCNTEHRIYADKNPDYEMSCFLSEKKEFKNTPKGTNNLIGLMFLLFIAGLSLIIMAKNV